MKIKCYKPLSNWLSWVGLVLMMGTSPIIQAATDCNAVTEISKGECESLLELYNSTDGANWKDNSGWNVTNTPCSWYGVSCTNGGVSGISFYDNKLTGSIPDFSALPNLTTLSLSSNQLSGSIPDFSALPNLTSLYLTLNQLSGSIPDFSALPNLQRLILYRNKLSGSIPDFSALPNLQRFNLHTNQLSGTIPDFSALPNLISIVIDYNNQLSGSIPDFSALPNLTHLQLRNNQLSGSIPDFSALPNLTHLSLSSNQLSGSIPDFSALPNLKNLIIDNNQLSGSIPDFSALPILKILYLHYNQLSGSIPDFSALPKLERLDLNNNKLCKDKNTNYGKFQNNVNKYPNCSHSLSISSGNGGSISRSPTKSSYNHNETVKLTATPNRPYKFNNWGGDCSGSNSTCQLTMDSDKSVTASFIEVIQELIDFSLTINAQHGKVKLDKQGPYNYNETVKLTATANSGYRFVRWEGDASGSNPNITITMDKDKTITAVFAIQTHTLSISSGNGGSISRSPTKSSYNHNETVKLTATANSGYRFVRWEGAASGSNPNITVTMDADKTITAIFAIQTHSLSISSGNGGSISRSPTKDSYNHNETVNLTATPEQCYAFTGWSGDCNGSSGCQLTMDTDKSVTANFEIKSFKLNINSVNGSIERQPNKTLYNCGKTVKLIARPNQGYKFKAWSGDANGSNESITVNMDADKNITAIFEPVTYKLNVSTLPFSPADIMVDINPNKSDYNVNETVTLTAQVTPGMNYRFDHWEGDISGTQTTITVVITQNMNITAVFTSVQAMNINPSFVEINIGEIKILNVSGGVEPYQWSSSNGGQLSPIIGKQVNFSANNANSEGYKITVTDSRGETAEATVKVYSELKVSPNVISMMIQESKSFEITGGKPPYNITTTAGQTSSIIDNENGIFNFNFTSPNTAGNITITITDALSRQQSVKISVLEKLEPLEVTPVGPLTLLVGETIELTALKGQPPYNWTVTNGTLTSMQGSSTTYIAPQIAGDYTISLSDDTGEKVEVKVTVYSELKVSPNVITMEIEETKSFEITGGKPPYNINNGQTSSITDKGNGIFSFNFTAPDTAGNITITVTDALSRQQSVQISVEAPKPLKVTPVGPLTLSFGGNIELTASDGRPPYNWTITDGQLTSKQGTSTTYIAPKIAGDNTITVTDDKGEKVEVKVKVISELICTPTLVTVILGDPNPVTFKAAGGAEPYRWSADNGPINPIEGPKADYQPPAQTGEYHVTCKDNKDSSITALVRVVPSVAITPAQIDLAIGEVTTLQVTGGQKPYIWITEAGDLSSTSGSRVSYTAPTRNGVYSITVMDALKQAAKARIQVLGNLIISPIKTVVTIGENIHLSAARGAEPYTWPDSRKGRTWNTKFTTVGRQEVVVTDAAGDTGLAVVDIIHAELGLTPQTAYLHPSEVVNFSVSGGTSPYAWSAEAGTLSNLKGQRIGYVAPEQPGEYTITVADGRDKVGQAKVTVTAGVTDSSGKLQTNRGAIRSGIIIDGVAHKSDHILTDAGAHIEISFPLTMPTDGQKYNTYGAILWTPPQAAPVFLFRTTNIVNPFQVFDGATFPVYQATAAGENVVIDIYRGALNGLTGQFNFYAGYAPTTATNVLDSLLFNSKPFSLEVK